MRYGQYDVPTAEAEVNFKVGQPSPTLLPLGKIQKAAGAKFAETEPLFLQYGDIPGYENFRTSLARFLSEEYKAPVDKEELMVTTGVTGGLSLFLSIFLKSGDTIFCEDPSYFLALRIFRDYNLNVVSIPLEEDGVDIVAFEEALKTSKPKFFYSIPIGHNPTGRTTSEEKRRKVIELAYKHDFKVVADEVYQLLTFPGESVPLPYAFYDTKKERVLGFGSFSKILAPALRLGWIQAPKKLLQPLFDCGQLDSSGGMNPVISGIVHQAIDLGLQKEHLTFVQKELHSRAQCLLKELATHMPKEVSFEHPKGGYFVLVKLPEGMQSAALLERCIANKVRFLPGSSFGKAYERYIRLSFSYYCAEDISVGVKRLADTIRQLLEQGNSHAAA